MRLIATTLLLCAAVSTSWAQREVPITTNSALESQYQADRAGWAPTGMPDNYLVRAKADCDEPEEEAISVLADSTFQLTVEIDTSGLDTNGVYQCLDCGPLNFGTATLNDQKLSYTANNGVTAGVDEVRVIYCKPDNSECSDTVRYTFLARRPGRNLFPAAIVLAANEMTTVDGPDEDLPGALKCNFFLDCTDNYEGRDQVAYFTDYSQPVADVVYRASRFRGVDSLCVVLCDEFGICDTSHYAFRIQVPALDLPFMDDFSYEGTRPDANLWLDGEVYVNEDMAVDPPSIGVATFDGIDFRGRPYGDGYEAADRLSSAYIDLSGQNATPVLSFWLQRGGIGDRPELRDSLVLEFKNDDNEWEYITSFEGMPGNQPITVIDTFRFYSFPIDADYFYDGFQFRFVNFSDRSGFRDNWHLDYVRLDDVQVEQTINDVAFTKPPALILADYSSMPWRHFQGTPDNELLPFLDVGVYNHAAQTLNASPSSVQFQELNSNVQPFITNPTLFNGLDINIPNGEPINRQYDLASDPSGFPNVWSDYIQIMEGPSFDAFDELIFEMRYTLNNTTQLNQSGFEGILRNDEVLTQTIFSDYFAYDDGTAESAIETSAGNEIAVAYTAGVADTIRGVQIQFPHTSIDVTDQLFRLKIWVGELDDSPEYNVLYSPDYASNYFDTLQGFTSYPLVDADGDLTSVAIPEGNFYVGWEQGSSCDIGSCVAIGYDRNRPQGRDFIFVNNGGDWEPIFNVTNGSLMIRPVVSGGNPVFPTETFAPATLPLTIYPNPAHDRLFLNLPANSSGKGEILVYNAAGQLIKRLPLRSEIAIADLAAGFYWLEVVDAELNQTARQKFLKQ